MNEIQRLILSYSYNKLKFIVYYCKTNVLFTIITLFYKYSAA